MNKDQGEEWKQVQINLMDSGNNEHTKVGGVNIHKLFFIFSLWESMISASENHNKSYLGKPLSGPDGRELWEEEWIYPIPIE